MFLTRSKKQKHLPAKRSPASDSAEKKLTEGRATVHKRPPPKPERPERLQMSERPQRSEKPGKLPKDIAGSKVKSYADELPEEKSKKSKKGKGGEKVARLLLALGAEQAAAILKQLKPQEIENVMTQMSSIDHITPAEKQDILKEFELLLQEQKGSIRGGLEETRHFLEISLGEDKAKKLLTKLDQKNLHSSFSFLEKIEPEVAASALAHEHPQVTAIALIFLKPKVAAKIMNHLPEKFRLEAAMRIARTAEIDPQTVHRAARILQEKMERHQGESSYSTIGGARYLAAILNQMDRNSEEKILQTMERQMPDRIEEVKSYLYSFEELLNLSGRDMRFLISQIDDNLQIATALRGATEELRLHFFNAMSHNRTADIIEEMEIRGALPLKEINEARSYILTLARLFDNEGSIVIKRDREEYV